MPIILIMFFLNSCGSRYDRYNADWIVEELEIDGSDALNIVGFYNFKIDFEEEKITPVGLYLKGKKFMYRDKVPFSIETRMGVDYIHMVGHPVFSSEYTIKCIDEKCCYLQISGEGLFIKMIYNGEIPVGKTDRC